jgi:hypothetical protein
MSAHDRDAFITAYVAHYGGTTVQADQILRGVETAYAEKQNAELHKALDDADAERVKAAPTVCASSAPKPEAGPPTGPVPAWTA